MKGTRWALIAGATILAMLLAVSAEARIDPGATGRILRAPEDATGCVDSDHATGPGQNVSSSSGTHWAGVIHVNIPPNSAPEIPTFCTDLTTNIHAGDCFQTAGATACPITWLLNNGYGPSDSLTNAEAAARQAAVWFYSDGMTVNTWDSVYARTQVIIGAVPSPCVLPSAPPEMAIDPPSDVNFLPGGETHALTVMVTQQGAPVAAQVVALQTDFGALSVSEVTTGSDGRASFTITSSSVGTAHITARFSYVLPAGTRFTKLPGAADQQVIVLGTPQTGDVIATATKTWESGSVIVVHKFRDDNTNGVQDGVEESLSGWTMRLYQWDGSAWSQVGTSKTTNAVGNAVWNGLAPGTYRAQETLQSGWLGTTPNPSASVTLAAGEQAQINFGNVPLALIRAWKFHDLDLDGEKDTDEPVLDGWTMNIDPAVNGIGSGVTAGGYVNFVDLDPNTYRVWETLQPRWMSTTAASQYVTVTATDEKEVWFGNVLMDLGDLPSSYGMTRLDQNGARHRLGALKLGALIDAEPDGQCCSICGGDDRSDLNPAPPSPDDEDGVVPTPGVTWLVGTVAQNKGGSLDVTVSGGNAYLNGWIDWGGDTDFNAAGDRIFDDLPVAPGTQTLRFDIPQTALGGATFYARFRLCTDETVPGEASANQATCDTLTGLTIDGEVEDYEFTFSPLAVVLTVFTAQVEDDHVLVTWETVSEINNQGFNLYRSVAPGGPLTLLDYLPSQGPGTPLGFVYTYRDYDVVLGETYDYWLESIDLSGVPTIHGPATVTLQSPTAVKVSTITALPLALPPAIPLGTLPVAAGLALAAAAWLRRRAW